MKAILTLAAAEAALLSSTVAQANDRAPGHWEWQSRSVHGPNRSNLPAHVRVWVEGGQAVSASCDCGMMETAAADCMTMPGAGEATSNG